MSQQNSILTPNDRKKGITTENIKTLLKMFWVIETFKMEIIDYSDSVYNDIWKQ